MGCPLSLTLSSSSLCHTAFLKKLYEIHKETHGKYYSGINYNAAFHDQKLGHLQKGVPQKAKADFRIFMKAFKHTAYAKTLHTQKLDVRTQYLG